MAAPPSSFRLLEPQPPLAVQAAQIRVAALHLPHQRRLTRMDEQHRYQQELDLAEARFEMAATMGEFADDAESRAEAERQIDVMRTRVATQQTLAANLIPNKPVILTLS